MEGGGEGYMDIWIDRWDEMGWDGMEEGRGGEGMGW